MKLEQLLSPAVKSIPPSGIRKFFDIVTEMEDAISLGVGEPDFVTPWRVREAGIYSLEKGHTYYTSNWGLIELRKEISAYLSRRFNITYNPKDEVIVTIGGSEAIDLAVRALVSPGDEVLIPEPSFVCYKPCTVLAGGVPVPIVTKAENQFKLTAEELKEKITPKTKLLVIPYPNNPTGGIMTKADLEAIADVIRDTEILVISDEIYAELTYEGTHVSFASLPGMQERTILINGFSKSYAMTGWRLGYAAGHPTIIGAMTKIHQYAIMSAPTTSQYAAIEALKYGDEDIKNMTKEYNYRRRIIVDGFRKMGLDCFEPLGAFYVFPSIQKTGLTSGEFCEKLLYEEKVAVVPGTAFGESGEGFVRCSYAYSIENINEALKRIERFLKKYI
ncbi:aminotransferase class I/II-fold pyridoxal phosphate-dependent enzyme [Petroclostridium sp. X23]|uniref:aminotransferase class I/II-fold pyridoxal phosphate-dependent enzyme n=1 Tax=Petroclostridium sp. X23 TaxID=3045146 RepID=UPI0024AD6E78|nr:aminotransferase class I/II-fold pyridoxal phosphate-dependent enzyme [Petroclostridium sp. X23]WHH60725.1 aminotransferase class I/II-fold pyridoxal phosphate-dependent enzyme [Petroclostridium sp. X23]